MERILIVGFGCAGYHAVKAMRESGFAGEIHVFTDCENAPVNPMLTTYYAADKIPRRALAPFGTLDEIAKTYRLQVHAGQRIQSIDYHKKLALCDDGTAHRWDRLLLATGASALVPPFPGSTLPEVYTMRTERDAQLLRERLEKGGVRKAVVVGASMVGIKVVELLQNRGVETTLADLASQIFPLSTLPEIAVTIERRVKDAGVRLLMGAGITSIEQTDGGLTAHFGEGSAVGCDLVVLCIGTRANTALAGDALEVRRGIVVDCGMQTNVPGVYAAGDCCEGNNLQSGETQIIGLWANAAKQGETAGKNMAGVPAQYTGNIIHNITHFLSMDFISFGDNRAQGEQLHFESPNGDVVIHAVVGQGRILCLNILDCYAVSGVLRSYFVKRLLDGGHVELGDTERIRLQNRGVPDWFIRRLEHLPAAGSAEELCETRGNK